jgi:hypothetical protein
MDEPRETSDEPVESGGLDEQTGDAMSDRQQRADNERDEPQDDSMLDKAKDKLSDIFDEPEADEDDQVETNPVTGQRRD